MPHGDAVIHGDGVEFAPDAACLIDGIRHQAAQVLEMHMTRHKLGKTIGNGDDGLAEIVIGHAGGAPQATRPCHGASVC